MRRRGGPDADTLAARIEALLPQTQCTQCGYAGCKPYSQAIAWGEAGIDQCPPGGEAGVRALAELLRREPKPVNPAHGAEKPPQVAFVREAECIGCTKCIQACPVDAIVGASKLMHTVVAELCTGCELCVPVCPVDCIALENASGERAGWQAWSEADARQALQRYEARRLRKERESHEHAERLEQKARAKLADLPALTHRRLHGVTPAEVVTLSAEETPA